MPATIVPDHIAKVIREDRRPTRQPGLLRALLAGEVIHFDDLRSHFNGPQLRDRHAVQLRTARDGKGGRYWWVEALS